MIPQSLISPDLLLTQEEETSRTYKILDDTIQGFIVGVEALKQSIDKVLNTEKYKYPIYGFSYGIDWNNLIGKNPMYVKIEMKRRICECLLMDERIQSVNNFVFNVTGNEILCTFDVTSIYGDIAVTKEVNV